MKWKESTKFPLGKGITDVPDQAQSKLESANITIANFRNRPQTELLNYLENWSVRKRTLKGLSPAVSTDDALLLLITQLNDLKPA